MRGIYTIFTVFGDVVCIRFPDGPSYPETGCAGFWEMGAERLRPLGRLGPGQMGHESHSYDLLPNAFFIGPENEKTLHIIDT